MKNEMNNKSQQAMMMTPYFLRIFHCDDPSAVERHLVIPRIVDHFFRDVLPAKDAVQSADFEPARTHVRPRWSRIWQKLIDGPESGVLDVLVRAEPEPEVILRRRDDGREGSATVAVHQRRIAVSAIANRQEIVEALRVWLHVKLVPKIHPDHLAVSGWITSINGLF